MNVDTRQVFMTPQDCRPRTVVTHLSWTSSAYPLDVLCLCVILGHNLWLGFVKYWRTSCVCSHSDPWLSHTIASYPGWPCPLLLTSEICFGASHWEWHLRDWYISSRWSWVTRTPRSITSHFCCDVRPPKKSLLRRQFLLAKSILPFLVLSWEIFFSPPLFCDLTTSHTKLIANS